MLYINFEIQDYSWQKRIADVVDAKPATLTPGALSLFNLRGYAADFRALLPCITKQAR